MAEPENIGEWSPNTYGYWWFTCCGRFQNGYSPSLVTECFVCKKTWKMPTEPQPAIDETLQ